MTLNDHLKKLQVIEVMVDDLKLSLIETIENIAIAVALGVREEYLQPEGDPPMHMQSEIEDALARSREASTTFNSCHEGLAVIEQKFLELRKEVFRAKIIRSDVAMRSHCVQIAAMALRFSEDLLGN